MPAGLIEGPDLTRRDPTADRTLGRIRRPFSAVQDACRGHLCRRVHLKCVGLAAKERQRSREMDDAAVLCGRLVLQNLKEHDSDRSYERRVAGAKVSGADVSTKNHSFQLVPKLRRSMCQVLYSGFTKLLVTPDPATGRPPPFAPIADKATVDRETGQMHGLILMVQGRLIALLALLLQDMLMGGAPLSLSLELIRYSMTCTAFDGQYQGQNEGHVSGLQVRNHFCDNLELNPKWILSRWDGAHRIELGMGDVREAIAFYGALAAIVANVQHNFLYGKGYDRVKKALLPI
eukprot:3182044-Prymnesium_polylepis.1